jgi:RNA polymerase sigma-70 factor (ECF subfamily)
LLGLRGQLKIKGVNGLGFHVWPQARSTPRAAAAVRPTAPYKERFSVALSEIDRNLLQRCLARKPRAWEDFVDRFTGLVVHVVNHSAQSRSLRLSAEDREDLVAQVFLTVVRDDLSVMRHFRGESSLATYLTVIARRVVVAELLRGKHPSRLDNHGGHAAEELAFVAAEPEKRMENRDEVGPDPEPRAAQDAR